MHKVAFPHCYLLCIGNCGSRFSNWTTSIFLTRLLYADLATLSNLLIPNCLRSNLSYSPLAALELYVKNTNSMFYGAHLYVFIIESTYKKCLREEWGKFTGYQLLSSFWLKVARTDEDGNTTSWDRGTLPIRNLYPKWWMLRFGRIRKVTNWILRLWFIASY